MITYINVRGIQMVGKFATILELFILLPVLVLVVIGLAKWHHNPFVPTIPPHQPTFHVFGVGLALGYMGAVARGADSGGYQDRLRPG